MKLRNYQKNALRNAKAEIDKGNHRPVIVGPTGCGKTAMAAAATKARIGRKQRVAWLVHRRELGLQAVATLHRAGVTAGYNGAVLLAPTQVVSAQAAVVRGQVPPADFVVIDELHHYAADSWKRILEAWPNADFLGFTATPERGDGRPLDNICNALVVAAQPQQLVERGYLVSVETHRPPRVQPRGKLARTPVDAYVEGGLRGKRNVVFASDTRNAELYAHGFRMQAIPVAVLTDKTPTTERDKMLADFAAGRILVLINLWILTEGSDIPAIEVVTLARPFGTAGAYIQAGGRGLRTSKETGKTHLTLLDLVGATHLHGDLLEDRLYSLEGEPIRRKNAVAGPSFCRVCGHLIEDCSCGIGAKESLLYKATNDPLIKFARIRRDDDAERAARLSKWMGEALATGKKEWSHATGTYERSWKSALFRFKAAYGQTAGSRIISQATAMREGNEWCSTCGHSIRPKVGCKCPGKLLP